MDTIEKKSDFVSLRAKGYSFNTLSRKLDVSLRTLFYWAKEFEKEIKYLKIIEKENYLESVKLDDMNRHKIASDELNKIEEALKNKDYNDLPLFELLRWKYRLLDKITRLPVFDEKDSALYSKTLFYKSAVDEEFDESMREAQIQNEKEKLNNPKQNVYN